MGLIHAHSSRLMYIHSSDVFYIDGFLLIRGSIVPPHNVSRSRGLEVVLALEEMLPRGVE